MKLIIIYFSMIVFAYAQTIDEPKELTRLRESWSDAKTAAIKPLDAKYADALSAMKNRFTKAGNLDAAVAVDKEMKALLLATGVDAKSAAGHSQYAIVSKDSIKTAIMPLLEKSLVYSNRDYTWGTIPKELEGFVYAQGVMRNLRDVEFKVTAPGLVYCAYSEYQDLHKEKLKGLLDDGWKKCGFTIGGHPVLSKHFDKGQWILPWVHPHGGSLLIFKESN